MRTTAERIMYRAEAARSVNTAWAAARRLESRRTTKGPAEAEGLALWNATALPDNDPWIREAFRVHHQARLEVARGLQQIGALYAPNGLSPKLRQLLASEYGAPRPVETASGTVRPVSLYQEKAAPSEGGFYPSRFLGRSGHSATGSEVVRSALAEAMSDAMQLLIAASAGRHVDGWGRTLGVRLAGTRGLAEALALDPIAVAYVAFAASRSPVTRNELKARPEMLELLATSPECAFAGQPALQTPALNLAD